MPRFVKVTKDNRNKDRGFIAVEAICAAFENKDNHNTEIMTIDGFWYEVVDGIEKVLCDAVGTECGVADGSAKTRESAQMKRIASPAVSDSARQRNHEETRLEKSSSFTYPKKGYGYKRRYKDVPKESGLPSGDGEGRIVFRTKAEDSTPHEPEGA